MAEFFRELRKRVGKETILVPGTAAIVVNDCDEILLMLRSDTGRWGLPGGVMDLGETVNGALERVLREDAGIAISSPRLIAVYSGPEFQTTQADGERTASVTLLFLIEDLVGSPRSDREPRAGFHPLGALPEPMEVSSRRFIDDWLASRDRTAAGPKVL